MKKIYKEPRTGKTTELIKMCANFGGYIVCRDRIAAEQTAKMAKDLNYNIPYPMTFEEFLSGRYHAEGVRKVYIDNADVLLNRLARGVEIAAIAMDDTSKQDEMYN